MIPLLLLSPLATADPPQDERTREGVPGQPSAEHRGWLERQYLTGDWGGLRGRLSARGVELELIYLRDTFTLVDGGLDEDTDSFGYLDALVTLDLEALVGWSGASFGFRWNAIGGGGIGDEVGDLQGISNIEAGAGHRSDELWLAQRLLDERLELKLGKLDVNSDYVRTLHGAWFLNSTFGISPTLFVAPTYPEPSFSANAAWFPTDALSLRIGVFDGALAEGVSTGGKGASTFLGDPADLFLIAEGSRTWEGSHPGRLSVGWWEHTGDFEAFDGGSEEHAAGVYANLDQNLATYAGVDAWTRALDGFVSVGLADEAVAAVDLSVATGIVASGVLGLEADVIGLGVTYARLSDEPGAGFTEEAEVALELLWRRQFTPWLALTPDVQVVLSPGGDEAVDDALVLGFRLEVVF